MCKTWIQVLQKYCTSQRKRLSTAARHRKISEEHQTYLPSNTHLEGNLISGLLGSFNGKWQGFSMVCSESELRLVELFTFPG